MFVEHLVSSVSYRTMKSYLCASRLLHTELCHVDLLFATPCREYARPPARPPLIPVTQNLRVLILSSLNPPCLSMLCLCALCAAWLGVLCVSDFYLPHPPAST